jgi:hypothetical protein
MPVDNKKLGKITNICVTSISTLENAAQVAFGAYNYKINA